MSDDRLEGLDFPANWDRLPELEDEDLELPAEPETPAAEPPSSLSMTAVAWADLVTNLAVCAAALLVLIATGHNPGIRTIPWAAGLGVTWWGAASAAFLVVRRGTVGMLLAGVVFADQVPERRVPLVLLVSLVQAATLGLTAAVGSSRSPLAGAGGAALIVLEAPSESP